MPAQREWWVYLVQWFVFGIVMLIVAAWLNRSRLRVRSSSEARNLVHPRTTLISGVVCFLFFIALAIWSNLSDNPTANVWTTAGFLGFALMGVPVIADYFFARHEVDETGMRYGRMFGQRGSFSWPEVQSLCYSPGMKWFIITLNNGTKVRISVLLMGLPEFARLALANAKASAIDEPTREILKETAEGNPPDIWG